MWTLVHFSPTFYKMYSRRASQEKPQFDLGIFFLSGQWSPLFASLFTCQPHKKAESSVLFLNNSDTIVQIVIRLKGKRTIIIKCMSPVFPSFLYFSFISPCFINSPIPFYTFKNILFRFSAYVEFVLLWI